MNPVSRRPSLVTVAVMLLGASCLSTTAKADSYSSTTIPDASGSVTGTGNNPDGSQFSWTTGGSVTWNTNFINSATLRVLPGAPTFPPGEPGPGGCCSITIRTGSTAAPGANNFTGGAEWVYISPFPAEALTITNLGTISGTFEPNKTITLYFGFEAFSAFFYHSGPQYKVYTSQAGLSTEYKAATPGIW